MRKTTAFENDSMQNDVMEAAINIAAEAVFGIDEKGQIQFINPAAERLLGWTKEEIAGKTFPAQKPQLNKFLSERVCIKNHEEVFYNKQGNPVSVLCSTTPLIKDFKIVGVVLVLSDLSATKKLEDRFQRSVDELAKSNKELEEFAYVASHDLQEPLRIVSIYMDLLGGRYKNQLDDEGKEFIDYAKGGAERAQILIRELLEYVRITSRGKPFEEVSFETVLAKALFSLRKFIDEGDISITCSSLPTVRADDSQIKQLFQNLVSNSIKFREPERPLKIHISAVEENGFYFFEVQDNGIGIESNCSERIFRLFQRLHARSKFSGTGMGLAVCKRIVERHGGRIWLDTSVKEGAKFCFTLPIHSNE